MVANNYLNLKMFMITSSWSCWNGTVNI